MDQPTTAVQRLGQVLHWAGIVLGILFAVGGYYAAADDGASMRAIIITVAVCFLVPFLIGRAALYVLAGE